MTGYKAKTSSHALDQHSNVSFYIRHLVHCIHTNDTNKNSEVIWDNKMEDRKTPFLEKLLCWNKPANHTFTSLLGKSRQSTTLSSSAAWAHTHILNFLRSNVIFSVHLISDFSQLFKFSKLRNTDHPTRDELGSSCSTGGKTLTTDLEDLMMFYCTYTPFYLNFFWTTPTSLRQTHLALLRVQ